MAQHGSLWLVTASSAERFDRASYLMLKPVAFPGQRFGPKLRVTSGDRQGMSCRADKLTKEPAACAHLVCLKLCNVTCPLRHENRRTVRPEAWVFIRRGNAHGTEHATAVSVSKARQMTNPGVNKNKHKTKCLFYMSSNKDQASSKNHRV